MSSQFINRVMMIIMIMSLLTYFSIYHDAITVFMVTAGIWIVTFFGSRETIRVMKLTQNRNQPLALISVPRDETKVYTEGTKYENIIYNPHCPIRTIWKNGVKIQEEWRTVNQFPPVDHPNNEHTYYRSDEISELHRCNGPALIRWNDKGEKIEEIWVHYGEFHRYQQNDPQPAHIKWEPLSKTRTMKWFRDGRPYRTETNNNTIVVENNVKISPFPSNVNDVVRVNTLAYVSDS